MGRATIAPKRLDYVKWVLTKHLQAIRSLFHEPRITLVIRLPHMDNGYVVIGDDDLDEAIGAIERFRATSPAAEAPPTKSS